MHIKQITSQHRNDFSAIMTCEHCGKESENGHGYNDTYYHEKVIPKMYCPHCNKNSLGETEPTEYMT